VTEKSTDANTHLSQIEQNEKLGRMSLDFKLGLGTLIFFVVSNRDFFFRLQPLWALTKIFS
jgi:hypothetical protein